MEGKVGSSGFHETTKAKESRMIVRKILLAAGAAALMSTPAWAHPGSGPGEHGNAPGNTPNHSDKGKGHGNSGAKHGKSHKCVAHSVGYVASGTLLKDTLTKDEGAETYSGTVEVEVTRTNHHAAADKGKKVTYEVSKVHLTLGLSDTNKDGSVGLDDVAMGDRVHVIGKITAIAPKCKVEFTAKTTIRRIVVNAPAQAGGKD
jgi:hypothetical protein